MNDLTTKETNKNTLMELAYTNPQHYQTIVKASTYLNSVCDNGSSDILYLNIYWVLGYIDGDPDCELGSFKSDDIEDITLELEKILSKDHLFMKMYFYGDFKEITSLAFIDIIEALPESLLH